MSIIRIVHNQENPFVQLNKKALWNENISLKAIGLWARCMSRPDNWRFNVKELVSKIKEGRRAVDGAIGELIEHNYAIRLEHWEKAADGKFDTGGIEYVFFEFPATQEDKDKVLEEFKKSFRHCCFGNRRNGNSRNDELLIHIEKEKEKEEKRTTPTPSKGKRVGEISPPLEEYGCFVKMKKEEYAVLVSTYGEPLIKAMIEEMNDYLLATEKPPYKNYPAAIRQWIRKREKISQNNPYAKGSTLVEDVELVNKIHRKYSHRNDITFGSSYIEFNFGPLNVPHIKFGDKGFREQVLNNLRKMNLPIEGL